MGKSILLQTSTPTLGEVLANGKIYYVPPFQRDYSWRLENWEDLWSDVRALVQGDSQYHYMGSLVLQPRPEENTYWIIDGQQRLTTLSLLAAAVVRRFSLVPQGDVDLLHEQWLRTAGDVGEDRYPDFLRHYLMSTGELIRSDRLFKHLRSKIKSGQAAIELLDTLEREGAVYTALLEPSDERWRGNQEQRALVRALRVFQVRQLLPVLMAAYRRLGNSNFQSVLRLGCVLSFRYHVIGGLNPNELEEVYVKASGRLEADEIKTPAQLFSALRTVYVSDEQFQNDFAYASIRPARKKKLLRYILCELERDASVVPRDFEEDEGCLEHILPENPGPGWEASFSARQHADFVGRLGNYTLLEPTLNREAGNLTFEQKRELYARSQYSLTRKLAELPEWTPEALDSRQRRLAVRATHVWRVDYAGGD